MLPIMESLHFKRHDKCYEKKYRNKFDIMLTGNVEYLGEIYHYVKMKIHIFSAF